MRGLRPKVQPYLCFEVGVWETRHPVERLRVFGKALNLPDSDVAGPILLAGLEADFTSAATRIEIPKESVPAPSDDPEAAEDEADGPETQPPLCRRFGNYP